VTLGKMRRSIGRLVNLYKLLWAEERLAALEARGSRLRDQIRTSRKRQTRLSTQLQNHRKDLRILSARVGHIDDQVDLLKSSLEVPQELIGEFHEWKARNPIPEQPLVTVTVATYNRARLLAERCIPSVLNQTYANLELIVVGDRCTDETEEAICKIDDPRLTFINLPERGSYPADPHRRWLVAGVPPANKALAMARGDFVTHLDDDDEYVPDRLEKLVKFAVENGCDLVWHPFWWELDVGGWTLWEASKFTFGQVTMGSVFYRSWFKKIEGNINAHLLMEPDDWNRFRRIKYVGPVSMRYPEPLLKHYREKSQSQ
jgi:hypothetical protein